MTDIVERLRATAAGVSLMHQHEHDEAAAEIEQLRESCIQIALDKDVIIERLRALLAEMPDLIKDIDGGNPETSTGWASEEMLDLWMRVRRALEPKP